MLWLLLLFGLASASYTGMLTYQNDCNFVTVNYTYIDSHNYSMAFAFDSNDDDVTIVLENTICSSTTTFTQDATTCTFALVSGDYDPLLTLTGTLTGAFIPGTFDPESSIVIDNGAPVTCSTFEPYYVPCILGQYVDTPATATSDIVCQSCDIHTYQDETGQTACKTCGSGNYTNTTGATQCLTGILVTLDCATLDPGYSVQHLPWNGTAYVATVTNCDTCVTTDEFTLPTYFEGETPSNPQTIAILNTSISGLTCSVEGSDKRWVTTPTINENITDTCLDDYYDAGDEITSFNADNITSCAIACAVDPTCVTYNYRDLDRRCTLFSNVELTYNEESEYCLGAVRMDGGPTLTVVSGSSSESFNLESGNTSYFFRPEFNGEGIDFSFNTPFISWYHFHDDSSEELTDANFDGTRGLGFNAVMIQHLIYNGTVYTDIYIEFYYVRFTNLTFASDGFSQTYTNVSLTSAGPLVGTLSGFSGVYLNITGFIENDLPYFLDDVYHGDVFEIASGETYTQLLTDNTPDMISAIYMDGECGDNCAYLTYGVSATTSQLSINFTEAGCEGITARALLRNGRFYMNVTGSQPIDLTLNVPSSNDFVFSPGRHLSSTVVYGAPGAEGPTTYTLGGLPWDTPPSSYIIHGTTETLDLYSLIDPTTLIVVSDTSCSTFNVVQELSIPPDPISERLLYSNGNCLFLADDESYVDYTVDIFNVLTLGFNFDSDRPTFEVNLGSSGYTVECTQTGLDTSVYIGQPNSRLINDGDTTTIYFGHDNYDSETIITCNVSDPVVFDPEYSIYFNNAVCGVPVTPLETYTGCNNGYVFDTEPTGGVASVTSLEECLGYCRDVAEGCWGVSLNRCNVDYGGGIACAIYVGSPAPFDLQPLECGCAAALYTYAIEGLTISDGDTTYEFEDAVILNGGDFDLPDIFVGSNLTIAYTSADTPGGQVTLEYEPIDDDDSGTLTLSGTPVSIMQYHSPLQLVLSVDSLTYTINLLLNTSTQTCTFHVYGSEVDLSSMAGVYVSGTYSIALCRTMASGCSDIACNGTTTLGSYLDATAVYDGMIVLQYSSDEYIVRALFACDEEAEEPILHNVTQQPSGTFNYLFYSADANVCDLPTTSTTTTSTTTTTTTTEPESTTTTTTTTTTTKVETSDEGPSALTLALVIALPIATVAGVAVMYACYALRPTFPYMPV